MLNRRPHAGQLRYHDFTLLREAHLLRQNRNKGLNSHWLTSQHGSGTILHPISFTTRNFFASTILHKLGDVKLKALERVANADPSNVKLQYDFLKELFERYPEAVVQRFEMYSDFATDERCALLYLRALQKVGKENQFSLSAFQHRLQKSGRIDSAKVNALTDLGIEAKGKGMSKPQVLLAAMNTLSPGALGAAASAASPMSFLSGAAPAAAALRGADPKHPIIMHVSSRTTFRDQLLKLSVYSVGMFIVVSAIGAFLDERGVSRAFGMGGKHMQEAEGSNVRFSDVKGVEEAKADLEEIVMYLKDPNKFTRLGGKLPRGLLLTGPPGTGKTMLAKAIAGEAGVPFFFSSGSQFEEVYVGLGAKRIRELFEAAKKKSPAIIFIDEIDAVGGSRQLKDQSALKMTLNELLVQMDGFEDNSGIIVIGATNFARSLDKALLRPGRFDKHVVVPLPDVGGRKEILEMYCKKTKLDKDVDLDVLARGTVGFSGADLYNLINQAALKASVDGLSSINMHVMEYAKDKIMMGAERKSAVINPETARSTAFHEAGHALVAVLTDGAMPVHKATIMPRGQALGMVMQLPEGDQTSMSYKQLIARLDVCMGGRVAEELVFGSENVSSGAVSDIEQVTKIANFMVAKCGFNTKIGPVCINSNSGPKFRAAIDVEVKRLSDESYVRVKELLKKHENEHRLLAETLLEYETLTGKEVQELVVKGKKPDRAVVRGESGGMNVNGINLGR